MSAKTPQTDQQPTTKISISGTRLAAGTMAAVTGAALASRLGVTGTLVGTAVISAASGGLATIYEHSVRRTRQAVADAARRRGPGSRPGDTARIARATGDDPEPDRAPDVTDETTAARPLPPPARSRLGDLLHFPARRWALAGGAAVATFGIAIGVVTLAESVQGKPLSGGHGTTLGQAFGSGNKPSHPSHIPSSPTTSPSAVPSSHAPTPSPSPSAGSPSAPNSPSSTAPSPSSPAAPTAQPSQSTPTSSAPTTSQSPTSSAPPTSSSPPSSAPTASTTPAPSASASPSASVPATAR